MQRRFSFFLALVLLFFALMPLAAQAAEHFTLTDLVLMARCLSGQIQLTPEQIISYDLSGDGVITLVDLVKAAKALETSTPSAPVTHPDYSQVLYIRNDVTVTAGDMTQVGFLIAGALNGQSEVNLTEGVPYKALIAGLGCLNTLNRDPDANPVTGPAAVSLLPGIATVMRNCTTTDGTLVLPQKEIRALAQEFFGTTKGLDGQNLQESSCEIPDPTSVPIDVTLVQFARFYHTTLGLSVFDVTIRDNLLGLTPGSMRIGMEIEVSTSKPFRIIGVKRMQPGELIPDDGFTSIVTPAMTTSAG